MEMENTKSNKKTLRKRVPKDPVATRHLEQARKSQAVNFIRKLEGSKEAMQIFIE
jgi:hypothetical protein